MQTTKLTCPVCGAEFELPENTEIVTGIAVGKDSNLGEIHPKLVKKSKAQERIEALNAAGIDTTNLVAINSASGESSIGRMDNGCISILDENDPVLKQIAEGGTIPERRLFRRWVMAQMFHMLAEVNNGRKLIEIIHSRGYKYQWTMTAEEFRVQAKLSVNDPENFAQRNRWFNRELAVAMCEDHIKKLRKYAESLKIKHCKGVPYVHINSKDIFLSDLEKKYFAPIQSRMLAIKNAKNPQELSNFFMAFVNFMDRVELKQSSAWINAYEGSGAYYTLQNLILFHGTKISKGCVSLTKEKSMEELEKAAESYRNEGYKMLAFMKQVIADNHIDIAAKINSWRKN